MKAIKDVMQFRIRLLVFLYDMINTLSLLWIFASIFVLQGQFYKFWFLAFGFISHFISLFKPKHQNKVSKEGRETFTFIIVFF